MSGGFTFFKFSHNVSLHFSLPLHSQMTALDAGIGGANTLGGTLAATLGTLNGGTLGMFIFMLLWSYCYLRWYF